MNINKIEHVVTLLGSFDTNIDVLREKLGVQIVLRDGEIKITGETQGVEVAVKTIENLKKLIENGEPITEQSLDYTMKMAQSGDDRDIDEMASNTITITSKGKPVKAKTLGQQEYVNLMMKKIITFGVGPAGTGKTFLAVAMAIRAFRARKVSRIILTRPAVEAGEKLGFLPGDLQMKVDPYLRPLNDALFEMFGAESYAKHLERGNIEIAPLAYMRGRTLDDSFIILDEAQNTTNEQMKMFLTRLGAGSQMVITGDITQIDLPVPKNSGLIQALEVIKDIEDIGIMRFSQRDVVRHRLVQEIVIAYDKYNQI